MVSYCGPQLWLIQFYGMVCVALVLWFMITKYLKYKFQEINDEIKWCLRYNNSQHLIQAIHKHNLMERMTREFNEFFKYIMFLVYYFGTPAIEILLHHFLRSVWHSFHIYDGIWCRIFAQPDVYLGQY